MSTVEPTTKSERREKKRLRSRYGMKIDGRSVMTIQEIIQRKAEQAREKKW